MPKLIEDWQYVVHTICQETNGPLEEMVLIAEAIKNRKDWKYLSDGTIPGTVLYPYQFSGWNTKDPNRVRVSMMDLDHPTMVRAMTAYKIVFEKPYTSNKIVNYHAVSMSEYPDWSRSNEVEEYGIVGGHMFYRKVNH